MPENRDTLLNQGYNALQSCRFQDAEEIFETLRQEDPHSGLILLGIFMAEKQIPGREELAQNWNTFRADPDFAKTFYGADPNFLPWLEGDMASLQETLGSAPVSFSPAAAEPGETDSLQKLLHLFTGIQIFLFVLVIFFVYRTFTENDNPLSFLMSSFAVAALIAGGTVILGPVYGYALLHCVRFHKALKILCTICAGIGCPANALFAIVFFSSLGNTSYVAVSDRYTFFAFFTAFCIHTLGLIFPRILEHISASR